MAWGRLSAKERRQEQDELLNPDRGNVRPNEPTRPVPAGEQCPGRCGGHHDFSMIGKGPEGFSDERSDRVVRCWYCARLSPFSQQRIAAWEQEQAGISQKAGRP